MKKFRIVFERGTEREAIIDEANSAGHFIGMDKPGHFIGLDGKAWENYGTKETPNWEPVFDAHYEIEILINGEWKPLSQL